MEAGRELDALVAEKVMGWKPNYPGGWPHPPKDTPNRKKYLDKEGVTVVPAYSTNIADAWEAVEKMKDDFWFSANYTVEGRWEVSFNAQFQNHHPSFDAEADTAPLAICTAALRAVGVSI